MQPTNSYQTAQLKTLFELVEMAEREGKNWRALCQTVTTESTFAMVLWEDAENAGEGVEGIGEAQAKRAEAATASGGRITTLYTLVTYPATMEQ